MSDIMNNTTLPAGHFTQDNQLAPEMKFKMFKQSRIDDFSSR